MNTFSLNGVQMYGRPFRAAKESVQPLPAQNYLFLNIKTIWACSKILSLTWRWGGDWGGVMGNQPRVWERRETRGERSDMCVIKKSRAYIWIFHIKNATKQAKMWCKFSHDAYSCLREWGGSIKMLEWYEMDGVWVHEGLK